MKYLLIMLITGLLFSGNGSSLGGESEIQRVCYLNWTDDEVILLTDVDAGDVIGSFTRESGTVITQSERQKVREASWKEVEKCQEGRTSGSEKWISCLEIGLATDSYAAGLQPVVTATAIGTMAPRSSFCESLRSNSGEDQARDVQTPLVCGFESSRFDRPVSDAFAREYGENWQVSGSFPCGRYPKIDARSGRPFGMMQRSKHQSLTANGSLVFVATEEVSGFQAPFELVSGNPSIYRHKSLDHPEQLAAIEAAEREFDRLNQD